MTCLKPIDEAGAIDAFTAMAGDTASGGFEDGNRSAGSWAGDVVLVC